MNKHLCLSTQGQWYDCQNCSVSRAGQLVDFIKLLAVRTAHIRDNYVLADYEREDIISEFVIRVHNQVHQYHGIGKYRQGPASFKTWANTIFNGVYVDHCRKKLGRKNASSKEEEPIEPRLKFVSKENLPELISNDTDSKVTSRSMAGLLIELMKDKEHKKYCDILIDHYEWGKEGVAQAEMAERYGISHENFRTTLSRARKEIKKVIGMNNE
jgi:RNA polymerase sigma factor (sigma-70 family)